MTDTDSPFLGRRADGQKRIARWRFISVGRAEARAGGRAGCQPGTLNVREFGATGDGKTDDTKAIQRALDAAGEVRGAVFVAPGVYLCADLQMRPNTALVGVPTWDYRGPGGTVLRLVDGAAKCLLNIAGAWGATIDGLSFRWRRLGQGRSRNLSRQAGLREARGLPSASSAARWRASRATG